MDMKKIFIKLSITMIVFVAMVWLSQATYGTKNVTIKEIHTNKIVTEDSREGQQIYKITSAINLQVEENKEYRIKYKQRVWQSNPIILTIEPYEKS